MTAKMEMSRSQTLRDGEKNSMGRHYTEISELDYITRIQDYTTNAKR